MREMLVGEFVTLQTTDGIGTIRLDRPPMNPLNTQVQEELRAAAQQDYRRVAVPPPYLGGMAQLARNLQREAELKA